MKKLGMLIDTARCTGCDTCVVACKSENNLPNDIWWNRVETVGGPYQDTPAGEFPNLTMSFLTIACQHCEDPPCVPVCPTGATFKREEDGVVVVNYDDCIGCGACVQACPYDGVRTVSPDLLEYAVPFPVGHRNAQPLQPGAVSKCNFCVQRLDEGREPACVEVCPMRARFFGDLNNPESEVSKLLKERESFTLQPEVGTGPQVYFLT